MAKIKVALRVRPRSIREVAARFPVVVGVEENSAFITDIKVPERPSADSRQRFRQFDFDHAFWLSEEGEDGACQEEVYEEMGTSLEKSILEGYNACLLAYGQSSTGKTHTMLGTKNDPGLILRLCQGLWKKFKTQCSNANKSFRMEVSFMEIYREKVRDLLAPSEKPLKLREHPQLGPHVQGLKRIEINEGLSILDLLWEGEKRRATGSTGSNRHSSRSHAIWTIYLTSTRIAGDGSELITRNQAHLVDLAGSERADLTTTKHLLAEGKDINRSLVSLGNVISSLAERAQYIPYRDSTLTWFLKDSLGGNATTAIIITASPSSSCHAQTLNSLRFAQRARLVENQPKINVTKYEGRSKNKRNGERTGIFSGISAFDLKKDISRLASMIRSAQTNGGILRSLTPSNGWNRLIAAIENWSHLDSEQEQEGRSLQNQSTSMETLTTATTNPSVADGQVQVNFKQDASYESDSNSSIPKPSMNQLEGNEVFIPMSSSFKCLTWRQQEIQQIPASTTASEDEVFVSLPSTPKTESKVNHLKYLVPVHYPVTRNVDSQGRISERIHGTIEKLREPTQIFPIEVRNQFENSPLIRGKYPTLVNPQPIAHPSFKESCTELNGLWDENLNYIKSVQSKCQESNFSFNIPNVSEFSIRAHHPHHGFESTDDDEDSSCQLNNISPFPNFCALRGHRATAASSNRCEQEQNDTGIDPGNSFTDSMISSSSYESLQILKPPNRTLPVKIVSKGDFNFVDIEEKLGILNCSFQEPNLIPSASHFENSERLGECSGDSSWSPEVKIPLDGSSSHFQKFFIRELTQLENIGRQLKNLKQTTERYNRLRPYLSRIDDLKLLDHSVPDPELDAEIEQCSGWNVNIESQKVQKEFMAITKILQHGASGKQLSESSLSNPESSGSISMESNRSSNASISHNDPDVRGPRLSRKGPASKSAPLITSTPQRQPSSLHVSPTFWSEFYKKMGPTGDNNSRKFSESQFDVGHEIQQQRRRRHHWRPFLPKTHNYLCHQNGYVTPRNLPNPHFYELQRQHSSHPEASPNFQGMPCNKTPLNHQKTHMGDSPKRYHYTLRSLPSEGSSIHDGSSQSEQYFPGFNYGSAESCSCQDSLDSNGIHWDTSFDNNFLNYGSYQHGHTCNPRSDLNYGHDLYLARDGRNNIGNRQTDLRRCGKY